ncbi:methyltransferase domain-containing protein [Planosporangium thailandense]|uniref:Methyltransferase domain-containing protein n=1 Tax=Planosporangium thailandense TaxID=765197 RepID=A0ABX0Y8C1_9ACTN|nr:methyltransferase domain-containing protein [Planosporangium thailandense]NJC73519.1 methyltransferase domain-containing protein [Planosporangium thailandense]
MTGTARARRIWERAARRYDRSMAFWERVAFAAHRGWLCGLATGHTLEVAIGTGVNIDRYPAAVRLTGFDLSHGMLRNARARAAAVGRTPALIQGDVRDLPFADASFDTVVCTLGLCGVPDPPAALREMGRVLVPGGRLLLLDHVVSTNAAVRGLQRLMETVTGRLAGEYFTRRPALLLPSAGFVVREQARFGAGLVERIHAVKVDAGALP